MQFTPDDFEKRLGQAKQMGATPSELNALRTKYQGSVVQPTQARQLADRASNSLLGRITLAPAKAAYGMAKPVIDANRDVAGGLYAAQATVGELAQRLTYDKQNKSKLFDREIERGLNMATPRGKTAMLDQGLVPSKQVGLGVQRGAGVASFIPAGKSLSAVGAVGQDALQGALYGASQGDSISPGAVSEGAVGSVIGGGFVRGTGNILGRAGKAVSSILKKTDNALVDTATKNYTKATPSAWTKVAEEKGWDLNELTRKHVPAGADYDTMLGGVKERGNGGVLGGKMSEAEAAIQKRIKASSNLPITLDEFEKGMKGEINLLKKVPGNENNIKALEGLLKEQKKLYRNGLNPKKLLTIKRAADSKFGQAVADEDMGSATAQYQKALANFGRKKLKTLFPDIKQALDTESEIFTLKPVLQKARGIDKTRGSELRVGKIGSPRDLLNPIALIENRLSDPKRASQYMNQKSLPQKVAGVDLKTLKPLGSAALGTGEAVSSRLGSFIGAGMAEPGQGDNYNNTGYSTSNYDEGNNIQGVINHDPIINPMSSTPQQEISEDGKWRWDQAQDDWVPNDQQEETLSEDGKWKWDAAQDDWVPTTGGQQNQPKVSKQEVIRQAAMQGAKLSQLKDISEYYDLVYGTSELDSETATAASSLRSEYFARTKENNFLEVTNSYGKIKSAPNTPAGDMSLIFGYMKMLDPASVVREGEYANAENTAGIPDKVRNAYNKALSGKKLNEDQRESFRSSAGKVYNQYKGQQDQIDKFYKDLARQYGIDPSLVGVGTYNESLF